VIWWTSIGLAAGRFAASLLYGLTPTDPAALATAAGVLAAVAAPASYVPARRAAKIDPMESMRQE